MPAIDFENAFEQLTGNRPFPWQQKLFDRFMAGALERSLDIPTGLGKTAVMAIWLFARANGAVLPRRLVYVVDRRAVVDQATDVAKGIRESLERNTELKRALRLERSLPISTLRGQHVDNKEWQEDPASPALIVGTVDMIGSRLLFEGYGISRKMRPYHAGLLGADSLVVLDEAHLVPPFEKLLETVDAGRVSFGPRDEALRRLVPDFKLLSLSATSRTGTGTQFGLTQADLEHPVVKKRLDAGKHLRFTTLEEKKPLPDTLAEEAWTLARQATGFRIIVFCDSRKDAQATKEAIETLARGDKKKGISSVEIETELFVGGRRVFERENAAKRLDDLGFIAGTKVNRSRPAFLIATSAGEVGVDLDADHMVCDLVAWERMVQRLGRVNRRGDGDATVVVVLEPEPPTKKAIQDALTKGPSDRTKKEAKAVEKYEADTKRFRALQRPFEHLPRKQGAIDASPGAIRKLKLAAATDASLRAILDAATTPSPLRPALSRPLVEAWSMTSLKEHTGRPEINPWLRGWIEDDPPQTSLVWRKYLPVRRDTETPDKEIEAFFEAAPPHTSEVLETEMFRVVEWLEQRAKALLKKPQGNVPTDRSEEMSASLRRGDVVAIALSTAGDNPRLLKLEDLAFESDDKKVNQRKQAELERKLASATLVVDVRVAGLREPDGLLDDRAESPPRTADDGETWLPLTDNEPVIRFRVRVADADTERPTEVERQWRQRFRFPIALSEDGEPIRWLTVEKWLSDGATEDDRSAGRLQLLDVHQEWAERRARELAERLSLPAEYTEMLAIAARQHDEGKRAKRWQRAFNAPAGDGVYAKTPGPLNIALLDGYRHEFGSLPVALRNERFLALSKDLQDLALHLIAAHHGFARPTTNIGGCEDAPPSAVEERAREVTLRFGRLQKRWGPWGLAWWEALLRAVDQQASRDNDTGLDVGKEST